MGEPFSLLSKIISKTKSNSFVRIYINLNYLLFCKKLQSSRTLLSANSSRDSLGSQSDYSHALAGFATNI